LPTPAIISAPNHKYHTFSISDFVLSTSDASVPDLSVDDVYITSVTSDEEENGKGDGNTVDDIFIVDCQTVQLRAERSGNGNGRVYTINLAVEDLVGNVGTSSFQVHVPKDKSGKGVIDDGPVYEVLSGCAAPGNFPKVAESSENSISNVPSDFMLKQNYPNPFNPSTTISYDIPQLLDGEIAVKVSVYNILGQKVAELFNGTVETGTHSVKWNGLDQQGNALPTGIYIYQITSEHFIQSRKMMYLK